MQQSDARRRATEDDVRRVLHAAPKRSWAPPRDAAPMLSYTLEATVDEEWIQAQLNRRRAPLGAISPSQTAVSEAAGFRRVSWESESSYGIALFNPDGDGVYLDPKDKCYLHFGAEQIPTLDPGVLKEVKASEWKLETREGPPADGRTTILVRAMHSASPQLVWEVTLVADPDWREFAKSTLEAILVQADVRARSGFPVDDVAHHGFPILIERQLTDDGGKLLRRLSRYELRDFQFGTSQPETFAIPKGYRDLRDRPARDAEPQWFPMATRRVQRKRGKRSAAATSSRANASTAATYGSPGYMTIGQPTLSPPARELEFDECMPSTHLCVASLEIRQLLLEHVKYVVNAIGARLTEFTGTQVDGGVELQADWLTQLQAFHDAADPNTDGIFCLLHEPAPADNPNGGRRGLLDRMARAEAIELLRDDEPLPFGGDEGEIDISDVAEEDIERVLNDPGISPFDRFQALAITTQNELTDAVLTQRFGTFTFLFETTNSGVQQWPEDIDLVRWELALQNLTVNFDGGDVLTRLRITDDAEIDVAFNCAGFTAEYSMTREPGTMFWVSAAATLLVGGAALLTPLGLLMIAVVAFLVWENAVVRVVMSDLQATTGIEWDVLNGAIVAPDTDGLELPTTSGANVISVSYQSQIPSGIHQILGFVTEAAFNLFDLARGGIEEAMAEGLEDALVRLPHLLVPLPSGDLALSHELLAMARTGSSRERLDALATTLMHLRPRELGLYVTQVDRDPRAQLQRFLDQSTANNHPSYLGFSLSQNLLNGVVHAKWIGGRFSTGIDSDLYRFLYFFFEDRGIKCNIDNFWPHIWAAASPHLLLTPAEYRDHPRHPYMRACFPDLRLCLSCGYPKERSVLEVQFAASTIAHVGFGEAIDPEPLTLITRTPEFLNLFFEVGDLAPVAVQGFVTEGPLYAALEALSDAEKREMLTALQPLLVSAFARMLQTLAPDPVPFHFDGGIRRFDQHLYDRFILTEFFPRQSTLYVRMAAFGQIPLFLPGANGIIPPGSNLETMSCEEALELLGPVLEDFV